MESIYRFATILLAILVVEASTSHRPPPIIEDLDDRGGMHEVRRAEHLAGDQGDVGDDNLGDLAYDGYDDSDDDSDDEAESGDYLDPMAHVGPVLDNEVDWKKLGKLGKKGDPFELKEYGDEPTGYEEPGMKRKSLELLEDASSDVFDTVLLPPGVQDNEDNWEASHPSQGGTVVRQIGSNLDPPASTCLNIKVVFNRGWMNHFGNEQAARNAAREVVTEAERIYQDQFAAHNRFNSWVSFSIAGGGKIR